MDRSGAKRPPQPIVFNMNDQLHYEFICSVAEMRGEMYGIKIEGSVWNDLTAIRSMIDNVQVPVFRYFMCACILV